MKKAVVVGVLVHNNNGEYLLVKKPDSVGPYKGQYLTPGGYIEENESVDDAAIRELYEETGVTVTDLKRVTFYDDFTANWKGEDVHLICLLYTATYKNGNLTPTEGDDDHLEVIRWFTKDEISKLPLSPPLNKLCEMVIE